MEHIIQKIKRQEIDEWKIAERYYTILSAINNLQLTEREIQLIAFTAIKGNISYREYRDQFCKEHSTSSPTINNIISKLKRIGIFIKQNGKVKINPAIILDFKKPIVLQIHLSNG